MKKISSLCAALLMCFTFALTAQAQKFSYGFVAGLNYSKLDFSGKNSGAFSSDNRAGWFFGPKVEFNTALGIGIDASLQYSQRKLYMKNDASRKSQSETYRTFELPINVRYNIGLGSKLGIYMATGPQFGFAIGNMDWDKVGTGGNFSKDNLNTTWNIGAGLRMLGHLEVGVGYNFALGKVGKTIMGSNAGNSKDNELKYKTNTLQVQVTYLF